MYRYLFSLLLKSLAMLLKKPCDFLRRLRTRSPARAEGTGSKGFLPSVLFSVSLDGISGVFILLHE